MNLRSRLRRRDQQQAALERLSQQFAGSEIVTLSAGLRLVQVTLANQGELVQNVWVNVDSWLQSINVQLPGIPWQQVPLEYLSRWLDKFLFHFTVGNDEWEVRRVTTPVQPPASRLVSLPAQPVAVLCVEWLDAVTRSTDAESKPLATRCPFTLDYILGNSRAELSQLADIQAGDLLIIQQLQSRAVVGQRPLFRIHYNEEQEVIVEEYITDHVEEYPEVEEVLSDWSDLPVDIEFVLDSQTFLLAELDEIKPGDMLPINTNAEQKIKIYLNKTLFARGELVVLPDDTLAVEVKKVNSTLAHQVESPDV
ncbi:FliM/FliN family flagellar motor switch protein [Pantoea agglomerans]|uniref:FliM/FliN family flagellar motor switch protein n=1 Tax=Enterobacter agglomerans TaxID=549 RepID=UPI0013B91224|nr:FliM/FliN family flagellar motor switch protein [Pantoea agglomerans]NEG59854.1 type III secretion system protein [Pantoea agglomerans]NEG98823.1 type III secretion system protein [Pantoea agglomerans]NEH05193.1 type III secretion system protein [Pantoea agglomerans]NEH16182.1 type III secretion system protein [Pantoea agglomerans]